MTIPIRIDIPQYIEIGRLIGREGNKIKPIAERTGTSIHVNTNTKPAKVEIKIINQINSFPPSKNRIEEARDQINKLIKDLGIEKSNRKSPSKKKKKNVKINNNKHASQKVQKEISLKKEKRDSEREMMHTINSHINSHHPQQPRNKQKARRNAPLTFEK